MRHHLRLQSFKTHMDLEIKDTNVKLKDCYRGKYVACMRRSQKVPLKINGNTQGIVAQRFEFPSYV